MSKPSVPFTPGERRDTAFQDAPVCPYCGHEERDAWEIPENAAEEHRLAASGKPIVDHIADAGKKAESIAFSLKMMLIALLDRDITYDGRNAVLRFESHDQAMNHIAEARRAAHRGYE